MFQTSLYPMVRSATAVLVLGGLVGCATAGVPSTAHLNQTRFVSGTFAGTLTVDGTEIEGLLRLTRTGPRFQAEFDSEAFGFEANGEGDLRGAHLELVLSYEIDCRGELRMRGTFRGSSGRWDGELVASDCTGDAAGTFSFVDDGR
jgi:hypothetical protein